MSLENHYATNPKDAKSYDTERLREEFLLEGLLVTGEIRGAYSHYDRMVTLGVAPTDKAIALPAFEDFTKKDFFLARRELGAINVGGKGSITVDGERFELENEDMLYVGLGKKEIVFESESADNPALFYINSCPAHKEYPTTKATKDDANLVKLGSPETSNERWLYQFIHNDGVPSCQLVMGFTELKTGSVWNTFPPHTHDRRMETYFYYNLPEDQIVVHFMGDPQETRHLIMKNHDAVISPPWSIHSGAGSSNYSFVWAMAGENKEFTDMDGQQLTGLK